MTLLEEEDYTIEDVNVEENQQLLIEGDYWAICNYHVEIYIPNVKRE